MKMAAPIRGKLMFLNNFLLKSRHILNVRGCRHLLTHEYKCEHAWSHRLQNPLLQKIDIDKFILKVQEKIDKEGYASAIDMDILANKMEQIDRVQLDFVLSLFYKFRHSKDAINVRESMSYAVVRTLLQFGETDRLLTVLRDKINYGIFLNDVNANILLDHFIENKQYQEAAEIAVDQMWQEDFKHPLKRALSWQACHLRLQQLLAAKENAEPDSAQEQQEEEVLYRRVGYIENPWYDDHFDIPTESQRIGKTLTMVAAPGAGVLERGYLMIGWALYEKFNQMLALLESWANDSSLKAAVALPQVEMARVILNRVKTRDPPAPKEPGLLTLSDLYPFITEQQKVEYSQTFEALIKKLADAGKLTSEFETAAVDIELARRSSEAFEQVGKTDTENHLKLYAKWTEERQIEVNKQIEQFQIKKRKEELAKRLLALKEREEKLRYFEQLAKIEVQIADNPPMRPLKTVLTEDQFVAPPGERKASAADAMKKGR